MPKRLSEREKSNIITAVCTGSSYRQAARQFGVSVGTVAKICKSENCKMNDNEHKKKESVQIDIVKKIEGEYGRMYDILSKLLSRAGKDEAINKLDSVDSLKAAGILIDKIVSVKEFGKRYFDNTNAGLPTVSIPASLIAPAYFDLNRKIDNGEITEAIIKGGRGGLKSSYVGLKIPELIMKNKSCHALVTRNVGNTIRDSVYAQIKWGIEQLGVSDRFECTVSPMQIVYKPTGQTIYFRGMDDPLKIKSIKVPFGYIGILWYEEFDQYEGEAAIRSVNQSALRGTDENGESKSIKFETFNPPASAQNWANRYVLQPRKGMTVLHTTYLDVPKEWLGQAFIDEAETLKALNEKAYENEYLGKVTGTGGQVFENLEIRDITDEEIKNFDRLRQGLDWGYYPDPLAFVRGYFDKTRRTLYIFDEVKRIKTSNEDLAAEVLTRYKEVRTIADSAEPKSISYMRSQGYNIIGAEKPPGSVEYGMKWLSSLVKIVIDRNRCPNTAQEFEESEYLKDKDGNYISGYPDKNNHFQDAVRYMMNDEIMERRYKIAGGIGR